MGQTISEEFEAEGNAADGDEAVNDGATAAEVEFAAALETTGGLAGAGM